MVNNSMENCAIGRKTTRRSFPPEFKLQVLQSYRYDTDCRGNQRATARKYGIHRRQIQKWIVVEDNLRLIVARAVHERSQSKLLHLPKNIKHEPFDDDPNNNCEINNNTPMDLSMKKESILDLSISSHDKNNYTESAIIKSEVKQHFDDYDLPRPQPMRPLPIYMNQVPFYYSSHHCCTPYNLNHWTQNQEQHQQVPQHQLYSSPQSCYLPPSPYLTHTECYSPIMDYCYDPHTYPYSLPYMHQHGPGINETAAMAIKFGMQVLI